MKQKMVYLGAAYAAGLFFASCFPMRSMLYLLLFAAGILLLLVWRGRLHWKAAVLLAAVFTLSSGWYYGYTATVYQPVMQYAEQETTFTGIVTHQTIYDGDRAGYQLKGTFPDGTKAKILCYTKDYGCRYGDELTVSGTMTVPSSNYLFAGTAYYKAKSIFLQASNDAVVTYTPTEGYVLQRTLADVRTKVQKKILWLAGTEDGSMMIAMLFGQKQLLDETLEQAFFRSGIGHVLSVSGFHMVILLLPLGSLGKKRLFRLIRFGITVVLIGLFAILTETPVSILRAGCMILLAQSSTIFYRTSNTLNALSISFMLLSLPHPYLIRDVSFLLSVSGTFGIGVFAPYLTRRIHPSTIFGQFGKSFLTMFLVFLCTLPVSCQFFSEVSLLSPLTNVLLMPFCSLILICTVLVVLSGGVLAEFFSGIAMVCCEIVTKAVFWMQQYLPLQLPVNSDLLSGFLLLAAGVICLVWCCYPRRRLLSLLLCVQIAILTVLQTGIRWMQRNTLYLSVLGRNAEAVVLVQYGQKVDVIDLTGHHKNPQYVQRYLQENGIRHIQSLALLQNTPQMEVAYSQTLFGVTADAVVIPAAGFVRQTDRICGQYPQKAIDFTITENAYQIQWTSSALQVTCAGRTVTITLKSEETAIREAMTADFTMFTSEQNWLLTEQRGSALAVLAQGDDLQIAIQPDGKLSVQVQ